MLCYTCKHTSSHSACYVTHAAVAAPAAALAAAPAADVAAAGKHKNSNLCTLIALACVFFCNSLEILVHERPERNIHQRNQNARSATNKQKPEQSQCTNCDTQPTPEQSQSTSHDNNTDSIAFPVHELRNTAPVRSARTRTHSPRRSNHSARTQTHSPCQSNHSARTLTHSPGREITVHEP